MTITALIVGLLASLIEILKAARTLFPTISQKVSNYRADRAWSQRKGTYADVSDHIDDYGKTVKWK